MHLLFFDEKDKFGSNQDAIIEDKLRKNNTKTSFFQAKEVFLRKYDDNDLTAVLNKNSTFINEMLLSCKLNEKPCDPEKFEFFQLGEFNKCFKYNSGKYTNGTPYFNILLKTYFRRFIANCFIEIFFLWYIFII